MKNLHLFGTVVLVVSSIMSCNLSAEIYTWTDKDGKVHFSDKPISDENVTTIKPKENGNISIPVTQNSHWQQDYNKTKQAKTEQAQEKAEQTNKNKKHCNNLKRKLAIYQQGGRIYLMSATGDRHYQSEEELAEKKKKLIKLITQNCR